MDSKDNVIAWLNSITGSYVGIDDGGIALCTEVPGEYYEIGGQQEDSEEDEERG